MRTTGLVLGAKHLKLTLGAWVGFGQVESQKIPEVPVHPQLAELGEGSRRRVGKSKDLFLTYCISDCPFQAEAHPHQCLTCCFFQATCPPYTGIHRFLLPFCLVFSVSCSAVPAGPSTAHPTSTEPFQLLPGQNPPAIPKHPRIFALFMILSKLFCTYSMFSI